MSIIMCLLQTLSLVLSQRMTDRYKYSKVEMPHRNSRLIPVLNED